MRSLENVHFNSLLVTNAYYKFSRRLFARNVIICILDINKLMRSLITSVILPMNHSIYYFDCCYKRYCDEELSFHPGYVSVHFDDALSSETCEFLRGKQAQLMRF
jgi:hypothetical protein